MSQVKRGILYGVLVWLIVFVVGFLAFPVRGSNRPLFESIMPVALSICVAFFSVSYFKRVDRAFVKEGFLTGVLWLAISIVIDIPLFLFGGPMKTTVSGYVSDIGITYLVIPVITIALGYGMERRGRHMK